MFSLCKLSLQKFSMVFILKAGQVAVLTLVNGLDGEAMITAGNFQGTQTNRKKEYQGHRSISGVQTAIPKWASNTALNTMGYNVSGHIEVYKTQPHL